MPPSSGGLLSVSHSDGQTVAHALPYRYTRAYTVHALYIHKGKCINVSRSESKFVVNVT